jgi:hypothetical protein
MVSRNVEIKYETENAFVCRPQVLSGQWRFQAGVDTWTAGRRMWKGGGLLRENHLQESVSI